VWCCIRRFWLDRLQTTSNHYSAPFQEQWRLTRSGWNDLLSGVYFRKLWPAPPGQKLSGEFQITHFWKYGWGELFPDLPEPMRSQPVPLFGDNLLQPADFASDELKALVAYDAAINSIHHEFHEANRVLTKDIAPTNDSPSCPDAKALLFCKNFTMGASFTPDRSASSTERASWMNRFIGIITDWPQCVGARLSPLDQEDIHADSIINSFDSYIPIYYQGIMDALRIPPTMLLQPPNTSEELSRKVIAL
jgi:hypothetical protein